VREQLVAKGYDGIVMLDSWRGKAPNTTFVAFAARQIFEAPYRGAQPVPGVTLGRNHLRRMTMSVFDPHRAFRCSMPFRLMDNSFQNRYPELQGIGAAYIRRQRNLEASLHAKPDYTRSIL